MKIIPYFTGKLVIFSLFLVTKGYFTCIVRREGLMCKEKKKNKLGRRILSVTLTFVMALTLVPTYAVQAETPVADTVQAEKEIITEKVATKDVVYSATPNSPIKLKELQEIDLSESVSSIAGGTIKLTAEDIDTTDLSGWYVYDHYDTMYYPNQASYIEGTGYNPERRPYFPETDTTAGSNKTTIADWITANSNSSYLQLDRFNEHILSAADAMGNASMTFVGYATRPYVDFLFYPADSSGTKNVDFTVDGSKLSTHTLYYAGFLFNTAIDENEKLKGYALILQYSSTTSGTAYIQYLNGVDAVALHNSTSQTIPGTTVGQSKAFNVAAVCDIAMTITDNHVKVTTKNDGAETATTLFDTDLSDATGYGGFGPIVGYKSHNCRDATVYKYSNLKMGIKTSSSIFASYFDADYAQKDKSGGNDKYYVVIGDPAKKDGFDIRNDKEALALLQKEGVVIITNLDIAKSNVGDGLDSVPNYNVADYLGNNVYKFPNNNNYAINSPEYYEDLKDFIQKTIETEKWKPLTNGETTAIAGDLGTGVEAVKPIPNTQLLYTTTAEEGEPAAKVTYQVANINADMLESLPGQRATITINDDLGYDDGYTGTTSYSIIKPDGTQKELTTNTFTVTEDVNEWPAGQYKVVTTFANGMTSTSTFGITNGLDVIVVGDGKNSNLWFDYATTGNNVARTNVDYETKIHAQDGYVLPDSVYIYVDKDRIGGDDLSDFELLDDSQYSYNPQSGVIRVNGAEVTGDIYIKADTRNIKYTLTTDPAVDPSLKVYGNTAHTTTAIDCFSSYYKNDGKQHNAYLVAPTGYAFPKNDELVIKATEYEKNTQGNVKRDAQGNPTVVRTKEYKGTSYYNANTGVIKFPKNAYDYDEIEVIAKSEPKTFNVTTKFQAINNTNTADASIIEAKKVDDLDTAATTSVIWHTAYDCTLKVKDTEPSYKIAESSIAVKVGGVSLDTSKWTKTDNTDGTYTIHINDNVIEGNVEISANAIKQYDVSAVFTAVTSSDGLTNTSSRKLNAQSDYSAVLSVDGSSDHPLSQLVKVEIKDASVEGGYRELTSGNAYTYNQNTGALTVGRAYITDDIKITANAGNRIYYELDNLHVTPEVKGVADGGTLNTVIAVDNDAYKLPETIHVYQGDILVSNYTYNDETGALQITGINKPVVIRATAVLKPVNVMLNNDDGCLELTDTTHNKASADSDYHAKLAVKDAQTGEEKLPEEITIEVDDPTATETNGIRTLTAGTDYTYNPTTGEIVVKHQNITGNIVIIASAVDKTKYNVTANIVNATVTVSGNNKATEGRNFVTKVIPNQYYELPDDVTVKVADSTADGGYKTLEANVDYTYSTNGWITVNASAVTGHITITGEATKANFPLTREYTNVTGKTLANSIVSKGVDFHDRIKLVTNDENLLMPSKVEITVSGNKLVAGEYNYYRDGGDIIIDGDKITGPVVIKAAAEYDLTFVLDDGIQPVDKDSNPIDDEKDNVDTSENYETTLTVDPERYKLPTTIVVKVNDETLTAPTDYTYDPTTGKVVVFKEKITGPVVIQAKPDCIVANDGTKCSITELDAENNVDDDNLAEHDKDYVAVITPNNGYLLPENIVVTAGDKTLVEGTDYTYDKETGKVVVNSDKVDGKLIIKAVADPKQFDVDTTGVKKAEVTNREKAIFDQDYTTTIQPNEGYALPDSINVTVGEEVLVQGTDYTYNRTTGEVVIKKEKITAPIVIEAKPDCVVVKDETKCSITELDDENNVDDDNLAEYGCDYVAVITPNNGYLLPENIDVTTGGNTLVEGTDYTYDTETGKVVVNSDKIAGNLTIKSVAVPKQFNVDTTGVKKAKVTNKEKATFDQDYTTTIKPNKGYALPDSINVTVGEEVLGEGTDYTYDSTTGEVVIPKESVVDDIKIAADMKVLKNDIVINTENLDTDAKKTVETDDEYKVIVKPTNNKYELPETIEVKVDGKTLEPGKDYTYDKKTGQVVIKKDVINGKVVINAQAIPIHVLTKVPAKAPTCTEEGNIEYYTCSKCSDIFADANADKPIDKAATVIKATGHKWGDWVVDESGKTRSHVCTVCGEKEQEAYDGSKANALALNAELKVDQVGKKIKIAWGKVDDADGYMLYWTYCGTKFSNRNRKTVKSPSITTYTIKKINGKKLNLKKNFKLYVVAYKNVDGKKQTIGKTVTAHIVGRLNNDYTNVKAVKVSKKTMSLSVNKTAKIKAKTVLVDKSKKQLTDEHAKELRYASTDDNVATVNAKGVVTGKSKGTCKVYVYARNGYAQAITVTVK